MLYITIMSITCINYNINNTFEVYVKTTELQFYTKKCFSQCFMVVPNAGFWASAERKGEIFIGFLSVVIGAYRVHPQHHFFPIFILQNNQHRHYNLYNTRRSMHTHMAWWCYIMIRLDKLHNYKHGFCSVPPPPPKRWEQKLVKKR